MAEETEHRAKRAKLQEHTLGCNLGSPAVNPSGVSNRSELSISDDVSDFLARIAGGIYVVLSMHGVCEDFDIQEYEEKDEEGFESFKRLLVKDENMLGVMRYWFDEEEFCAMLAEKELHGDIIRAMCYLGGFDVTVEECHAESSIQMDEIPEFKHIVARLKDGSKDFLTWEKLFKEF